MQFEAEYILLTLGNSELQIRYYGIIVVTAMLLAALAATRLAKFRGMNPDHIWGGLTWAIIPGIIGARLWFVVFPPISSVQRGQDFAWFMQNFFNLENGAVAIWSGGLSIFGAVIGGVLGLLLYLDPMHDPISRFFSILFYPFVALLNLIFWLPVVIFNRITGKDVPSFPRPSIDSHWGDGMPISPWLDVAAISLPLAQGIGRMANFVNQELYGLPTGVSWWGIPIDAQHRVGIYRDRIAYPTAGEDQTLFHPLFLYEAIWNIVAFFVLSRLYRRYRHIFADGDFMLLYLIQYAFIRFMLEFLRIEIAQIPGTTINSSQALTAVVFVVALLVLIWRHRRGRPADVTLPPLATEPLPPNRSDRGRTACLTLSPCVRISQHNRREAVNSYALFTPHVG